MDRKPTDATLFRPEHPIKVLFLCTGNSCRSQMAEALLRHLGGTRFDAASAGSRPAGYVHPLAIAAMEKMGLSLKDARSKHADEFADQSMDIVITLCDSAAQDVACPTWPPPALRVHWPVLDPAALAGEEAERLEFASLVAERLKARIEELVALDFSRLTPEQLLARLEDISLS